ncbi:MAG TPA: formimidoylglutamase [Myxococcales bacterium]|nr:formimidoylglutamase [Myxococcales bacterium]
MANPLKPANPALFYKGTSEDPRLGDSIVSSSSPDAVARAGKTGPLVAMIGHADDRAVVNGRGRPGAAQGPTELRRYLSRLTPGDRGELERISLHDLGDATAQLGTIEDVHASIEEVAFEALRSGACVVLLGGGHDGAYASHSALLRATSGRVHGINVDAHFDVRPLRDGAITSGTPFRRIAERWGDRYAVTELGIQPQHNARAHRDWAVARGFTILELAAIRGRIADALAQALRADAEAIAVSLDLDSVEASAAPGVSAPCPDGLAAADLYACARLAGRERRVRVLDVMELAPPLDLDGRTARLGAAAIWHFLAGLAER